MDANDDASDEGLSISMFDSVQVRSGPPFVQTKSFDLDILQLPIFLLNNVQLKMIGPLRF